MMVMLVMGMFDGDVLRALDILPVNQTATE